MSTATAGKARITLAGFVAGLLALEDRAGVEVIGTTRNGSGTRVQLDASLEAAALMVVDLDVLAANKAGGLNADQRRAARRAVEAIEAALVDVVEPDPSFAAKLETTVDTFDAQTPPNGLTREVAEDAGFEIFEEKPTAAEPAEIVADDVDADETPAPATEYVSERQTFVVPETPAPAEQSGAKWAQGSALDIAQRKMIEREAAAAAALAATPKPRNAAQLRAVATMARRNFEKLALACGVAV